MTNLISVNNVEIRELIYHGLPVVTFDMVANVHGTTVQNVRNSYQRNSHHFVAGKHTFLIEDNELQELIASNSFKVGGPSLRVFTEQGYYMLVKPMRDEVSWRVQSEMAETYFKVQHALIVSGFPTEIDTIQGIMQKHALLGDFFGAPRHIMLIEASKDMVRHGIDTHQYLLASPEMDNIPDEDVWLEPTELGTHFGMSGKEINLRLGAWGLQSRASGQWAATDAGSSHCMRHSWVNGSKSGYNLKWRLSEIRRLMDS